MINTDKIVDLMKNGYGNYVVQKALKLATGKLKIELINLIMKNLDKIGDRKLLLKWRKIVESSVLTNYNSNIMFNPSYVPFQLQMMNNQQQFLLNNSNQYNMFSNPFGCYSHMNGNSNFMNYGGIPLHNKDVYYNKPTTYEPSFARFNTNLGHFLPKGNKTNPKGKKKMAKKQ